LIFGFLLYFIYVFFVLNSEHFYLVYDDGILRWLLYVPYKAAKQK